ncbi:MAG: DUF3592 domain-containing protein [Chloroflexi bacterium]|nr:DUF3592 domain-containing protein [Chloroflexota bacterium]
MWPESGQSFSQKFDAYLYGIWAFPAWWARPAVIAISAVAVISGIGWLLFGWVWLRLTVLEVVNEIKSTSWPKIEGTITSSGVQQFEGMYGPSGKEGPDWYQGWCTYRYRVGNVFRASGEYIGGSYNEKAANERVSKYPPGMSVTVYYNPEKPHVSTLKQGLKPGRILLISLGSSMFLAAGIALLVLWLNIVF